MALERSNAAFDTYLAKIDDAKYVERIREAQWAMVERGDADMDTAFVLAVEAAR